MNPEIQYFSQSGTWVKPAGAVRVDVVLQGAGGGGSVQPFTTAGRMEYDGQFSRARIGTLINPNGYVVSNGEPGEISVSSFDAAKVADVVEVTVGKGGRPGGRDGYALIITHLADPALPQVPPHDLILHAHAHEDLNDGEPHEHLHTGPGHMGTGHVHPHRHAPSVLEERP